MLGHPSPRNDVNDFALFSVNMLVVNLRGKSENGAVDV